MAKIGGDRCLEVSESHINEFPEVGNGIIGRKMRSLAKIVSIILDFYLFPHIFEPILTPLWPKSVLTDVWRCLKVIEMNFPGWKMG